jgi:hypothetical protein
MLGWVLAAESQERKNERKKESDEEEEERQLRKFVGTCLRAVVDILYLVSV